MQCENFENVQCGTRAEPKAPCKLILKGVRQSFLSAFKKRSQKKPFIQHSVLDMFEKICVQVYAVLLKISHLNMKFIS